MLKEEKNINSTTNSCVMYVTDVNSWVFSWFIQDNFPSYNSTPPSGYTQRSGLDSTQADSITGSSVTRGGGGGGGGGGGAAGGSGGGGTGSDTSSGANAGTANTGGGGGGGRTGSSGGAGGAGGGGAGTTTTNGNGTAGTANRGGGGGGSEGSGASGDGGSGIVIVRLLTADWGTITGGTQSTDGAYTVCQFTTSGSLVLANASTQNSNMLMYM